MAMTGAGQKGLIAALPTEAADCLLRGPVMVVNLSAIQSNFRLLARRTMLKAVSRIGTPRMTNGMKSGAKKKNVDPLELSGVRPPTSSVEHAIRSPSSSAPPSPMKIRAGWKL